MAWGADLSEDASLAAVVTIGPAGSTSVGAGGITVLNAATGGVIWSGGIDTLYGNATSGDALSSLCLQISPPGAGGVSGARYLAIGTVAGDLILANLSDGTEVARKFLKGEVREIRFEPDGSSLYAGSGDGNLYKLDLTPSSGASLLAAEWVTYVGSWPFVGGLTLSPDGTHLAVATKLGDLAVLRRSDGTLLWSRDTGAACTHIAFSPDGTKVAGASTAGISTLHFTSNGTVLRHFDSAYNGGFSFSANGSEMLAWELDGALLDTSDAGQLIATASSSPAPGSFSQWTRMTGDGQFIVATFRDVTGGQTNLAFLQRIPLTGDPPSITAQPVQRPFFDGMSAALSVAASGPAPLAYQWYLDGSPIDSATSARLLSPAMSSAISGNLTVVVTNPYGSVESDPVPVAVSDPAADLDGNGQKDLTDWCLGLGNYQPPGATNQQPLSAAIDTSGRFAVTFLLNLYAGEMDYTLESATGLDVADWAPAATFRPDGEGGYTRTAPASLPDEITEPVGSTHLRVTQPVSADPAGEKAFSRIHLSQ